MRALSNYSAEIMEVAEKAAAWGFDGLELACWGDHFDVRIALSDPAYKPSRCDFSPSTVAFDAAFKGTDVES
jgi:hypothetical protein